MLATFTDSVVFSFLKNVLFHRYKIIDSFLSTIEWRKTIKAAYPQGHYCPFGEMGYTSRSNNDQS